MNCIKIGLPRKLFSVREKVFGKSYSLENSLPESIFREDLFLYNCLQVSALHEHYKAAIAKVFEENKRQLGHERYSLNVV